MAFDLQLKCFSMLTGGEHAPLQALNADSDDKLVTCGKGNSGSYGGLSSSAE